MAVRYRLQAINERDKNVLFSLQNLAQASGLDWNNVLDQIENTSKLSPELSSILQQRDPTALSTINDTLSRLPSLEDAQRAYLKGIPTDETKLSEEEIQGKLTALQNLQGKVSPESLTAAGKKKVDITNRIKTAILDTMHQTPEIRDLVPNADTTFANNVANKIMNNEIKNSDDYRSYLISQFGAGGALAGSVRRENLDNLIIKLRGGRIAELADDPSLRQFQAEKTDVSADISRVSGLLQDVQRKRVGEKQLGEFIGGLPSELAASRQQFLESQIEPTRRFFREQLAPEILQQANVRGTIFSGDLPSELARGAAQLQGGLEQTQLGLMSQDDAFFQQAGYQEALRKEIEAGKDITADIASQRQIAETQQQERFIASEAALSRQQQSELFRRQSERALFAQQQRLQQQQQAESRQRRSGLFSSLGRGVGGLVGLGIAGASGFGSLGLLAGLGVGETVGGFGGETLAG